MQYYWHCPQQIITINLKVTEKHSDADSVKPPQELKINPSDLSKLLSALDFKSVGGRCMQHLAVIFNVFLYSDTVLT